MGVNKQQPHLHVLPEDDANHRLATGFQLRLDSSFLRRIQVLPVAGGWVEVLNRFKSDHVSAMEKYPLRSLVLVIDFDTQKDRLERAKAVIPAHLTDRVFILGAWTEPEDLKRVGLGTYEEIGSAMARDCREDTDTTWGHNLLRHNASEIARLREHVRPILFQST